MTTNNSTNLQIDLSTYVNPFGDHVAPGEYVLKLIDIEEGTSKEAGNRLWRITYQIVEDTQNRGKAIGKTIIDRVMLEGRGLFRAVQFLEAFMNDVPYRKISLSKSQFLGKTVRVSLQDNKYGNSITSQIGTYFPIAESPKNEVAVTTLEDLEKAAASPVESSSEKVSPYEEALTELTGGFEIKSDTSAENTIDLDQVGI